ncbi:hypothetical protein [Bartonella sp. 220B]|uniref:hypothetical protein n=1 Tax=Bartonella sp. 220B TaxID=2967260 RepID=UPI002E75A8C5|nr:hypothetical protein [Bartonella sp. 220B]
MFFLLYTPITIANEKNNVFDFPYILENYTLTEDFLLKVEQIEKDCKNLPPEKPATSHKSYENSLEGFIALISDQPKLMALLRKNNITPKDFALGNLAIQAAVTELLNESFPGDLKREGFSFPKKNSVFLSNLEFGKKHLYRMLVILKESCK